ncbi:hypothetical protein B0H12DRAFT_857147 [Mycena haematopus]|nr:hypothetical protein B0H12DRAFT_857147 [Mycena haematopus]
MSLEKDIGRESAPISEIRLERLTTRWGFGENLVGGYRCVLHVSGAGISPSHSLAPAYSIKDSRISRWPNIQKTSQCFAEGDTICTFNIMSYHQCNILSNTVRGWDRHVRQLIQELLNHVCQRISRVQMVIVSGLGPFAALHCCKNTVPDRVSTARLAAYFPPSPMRATNLEDNRVVRVLNVRFHSIPPYRDSTETHVG